MATPEITVSLVTYDGAAWLRGCLESLLAQDVSDYELLIHDNASTDDSAHILAEHVDGDARASLFRSPSNVGYAAAHNRNIAAAKGEFVLLLNQDVELDAGFLSAVVAAFAGRPQIGSVQPRLRQLDDAGGRLETLDTTGLRMGRDRRAVSRSQGLADGADHQVSGRVWGVDGPAPAYRRQALEMARLPRGDGSWEVLDEDFFLYKEDVDLAWRLSRLGWTAWYEPSALGWHARGTGGTGATSLLDVARTNRTIRFEAKALSWRNQRLMQIKNEDFGGYLRDLPWIMRRELLSMAFIMVFDPRRLAAVAATLRLAPSAMRKRGYLQRQIRRMPGRRGEGSR
jgi:GT2 family glycosyltransferase